MSASPFSYVTPPSSAEAEYLLFAATGLKEQARNGNTVFIRSECVFVALFMYMDYGFAVSKHQEEQLLQVAYC